MKFPPGDLNPNPFPPHFTNTYTCRVTIAPRECSGHIEKVINIIFLKLN